MAPDDPPTIVLRNLLVKLELDGEARARLIEEVADYSSRDHGERAFLALVAVDLDRFYTSVESSLEAVARGLDGAVPSGPNWHRDLLEQLAAPSAVRPAVLQVEARRRLEVLLRFRSFLRHAYAVDLDWAKLGDLVAELPRLHAILTEDLGAFRRFVERCLRTAPGSQPD